MAIKDELLYDLYVNKKWSIRKINREYGGNRDSMSRRLKEMGVGIKGNHPGQERRYINDVDELFFQKETPEKYYVLGFFFADGSFIHNGIKFDQTIADKEVLIKIKEVMKSEAEIKTYEGREVTIDGKTYKSKPMTRIVMSRVSFKEELLQMGFKENKTYEESKLKIPQKFYGDFLRGFFDGDGTVAIEPDTVVDFTIKNKGNAEFIINLIKGIGVEPHLYYWEDRDVYSVRVRKKEELIKLRQGMYKNANLLYLTRKKERFDLL